MLFSSFRLPQPGLLNLTGLSQVHSTTSDSRGKHQAELKVLASNGTRVLQQLL